MTHRIFGQIESQYMHKRLFFNFTNMENAAQMLGTKKKDCFHSHIVRNWYVDLLSVFIFIVEFKWENDLLLLLCASLVFLPSEFLVFLPPENRAPKRLKMWQPRQVLNDMFELEVIMLFSGALNFRDVMLAYGKLPRDLMAHGQGGDYIGLEFSGKASFLTRVYYRKAKFDIKRL